MFRQLGIPVLGVVENMSAFIPLINRRSDTPCSVAAAASAWPANTTFLC